MKHLLFLSALLIVAFASCKKDTNPASSNDEFGKFLQNSQWVGVLDRNGYQFAPPANLRFKSANSFVIYAPFFFLQNGNWLVRDSLTGEIKNITEMPDGITVEVKSQLEHYGEVTFNIKDRKTLKALSTDPNKPVLFELELYTGAGFSVEGTRWSGPVMTGSGPTAGMVAYPDVSTIGFGNNTTYYHRNGAIVLAQPTPQIPTPGELRVLYKQIGAAIFMSGYSENGHLLIPYFGVLTPGNDKMMVFSAATGSRLPYYTQTIAWYGPIGQTPVIGKL
jgi:hypothetical protein